MNNTLLISLLLLIGIISVGLYSYTEYKKNKKPKPPITIKRGRRTKKGYYIHHRH